VVHARELIAPVMAQSSLVLQELMSRAAGRSPSGTEAILLARGDAARSDQAAIPAVHFSGRWTAGA